MKLIFKTIFTFLLSAGICQGQTATSSKSSEGMKVLKMKTRVVKGNDTAELFQKRLDLLKEQLKAEKDIVKRYSLFSTANTELSKVSGEGQRPADEKQALDMAIVLDTFNEMPIKAKFNSKQCKSYQENAKLKMGTRATGEPEDPGVVKALEVIQLVCGS